MGHHAALFVYLLLEPLHAAAVWAADNIWMIFVVGSFYGIFFVDLCISFNVSLKIRKAAAQLKEAVHYEQLKAALNERRAASRQKRRFLFPFAGASLADAVRELHERNIQRLQAVRDKFGKGRRGRGSNENGSGENAGDNGDKNGGASEK